MKLPANPTLANVSPELQRLVGKIASQVNAITEGTGSAYHTALTAAPTTGTWAQGDWVKNSAPAEAGSSGAKYAIFGWVCTVSGTPGTWVPMWIPTEAWAGASGGPFDVHGYYPGTPPASVVFTRVPVARAVDFPANLSGSYGKASAAATASTDFVISKNGTTVGTMNFAIAASTATFTTVSGAAFSLAAGDVLKVVAPVTPDATLADVGFVLAGTR